MTRILLLIVIVAFTESAYAARWPNTVQKRFIVEGKNATVVAEFLGFSAKKDGEYHLPWAPDNSECYKGSSENGPIYQLCNPIRHENIVIFYAGPNPKLIMSGYWLDGETGSIEDVPKYSFMSPDILKEGDISAWRHIADKFSGAMLSGNASKQVLNNSSPLVVVSFYKSNETSKIKLGIDDRSPQVREQAQQAYANCIEESKKNPMRDGGC